MFILMCNNCYSTNLKEYEGKMTKDGLDWFTCKDCKKNFPFKNAGYTN